MGEGMKRTIVVMLWVTILTVALVFTGAKFYLIQRTNHIKLAQKECLQTVGSLYSSGEAPIVLPPATTASQVEAGRIMCVVQYPISY
jgi:hypothetical protein